MLIDLKENMIILTEIITDSVINNRLTQEAPVIQNLSLNLWLKVDPLHVCRIWIQYFQKLFVYLQLQTMMAVRNNVVYPKWVFREMLMTLILVTDPDFSCYTPRPSAR